MSNMYFVQNLSWYPTFLKNFAIFCKFLHLISENWDFLSQFEIILMKNTQFVKISANNLVLC